MIKKIIKTILTLIKGTYIDQIVIKNKVKLFTNKKIKISLKLKKMVFNFLRNCKVRLIIINE